MKIGIDARLYDEAGNGRYIRNLLCNLQKTDRQNSYFVFLLKKFEGVVFNKNFTRVLTDIKWYGLKEQLEFPRLLYKYGLDLVHFTHFNVPIFYRRKFVVTIHDLIHRHFRMKRATTLDPLTYKVKQLGYNLIFKNAVNQSAKIIVPSEYVKKSLVLEWGAAKEKIVVTPEAVDDKMLATAGGMRQREVGRIRKRFNINLPYIFYVGNAHPHKNVEGLINAFLKLRAGYGDLNLILAGKDNYFWQKIKNHYPQKDIKYIGFVTDEELVALYRGALCCVMPSFEEGFGIPLLEAFACGCPVVASDVGALREVGKDAALFFDPGNKGDMGEKIGTVLKSDRKRKELIKEGLKRYREFSWRTLAEKTLEVYLQCV